MLAASIPPKFSIPFGAAAGTANIRPIPVPSQQGVQPGAASLTDGFVPLNFQAIAAGGVPPFGQDMNGILNQITLWNQWHAAGGPLKFDAAFATSIGGYPAGGTVQSTSGHAIYESLQDNNSANPNTGSALWRISSCTWSATATQATGSANIQIITLSPAPTSLTQLIGIPLTVNSQGTSTGSITINPNGLGAIPLLSPNGESGLLLTGESFSTVYNGSAFIQLGYSNPTVQRSGSFGPAGSLGNVGTTNWTVPAGVYRVRIRAWGAGGGGAGSVIGQGGGGGGGGGYSEGIYPVVPGQVLVVVVGAGGVGAPTASGPGATGGTTFVSGLIQSGGGAGGLGASPWAGGVGGLATLGNILNLNGGHGSAGSSIGGTGAAAPMGGAGDGSSTGAPGGAGLAPGGGGAGFGGGAAGTGSSGAAGIILFDW